MSKHRIETLCRPPTSEPAHDAAYKDEAAVTLSKFAYRAIADLIVAQGLQDGIVEAKLADTLGMSRTPVREALQRLEGLGLVVKADGGRSFDVKKPKSSDLRDSLSVRELLEPGAAAETAMNAPQEEVLALRAEVEAHWTPQAEVETIWRCDQCVHNLVIDYCGNAVLAEFIEKQHLLGRLARSRIARRRQTATLMAFKDEHLVLIDAFAERDRKKAFKAMLAHIRRVRRLYEN